MSQEEERPQVDRGDGNTDSGPELTGGYGGSTGVGDNTADTWEPADPGSPADEDAEGRAVSTDPDALGNTASGPGLTAGGTGTAIPEGLLAHASLDDLSTPDGTQ
jgi:hypothetical protein